jgi:hypothetical protein
MHRSSSSCLLSLVDLDSKTDSVVEWSGRRRRSAGEKELGYSILMSAKRETICLLLTYCRPLFPLKFALSDQSPEIRGLCRASSRQPVDEST